MVEPFKIICPGCKTILLIDRTSGKIVEVREPLVDDSSGDRFTDAFKKIKKEREVVEEKFKDFQKKEKEKKKGLEDLFKETLKKAKDSGEEEKPEHPLDFD